MAAKDSKNKQAETPEPVVEPAVESAPEAPASPEQPQIQIRMDDREMRSSYANGFRTNTTADEVVLDFGLNLPLLAGQDGGKQEFLLKLDTRIIMNHYAAKRLVLTLGQLISRHEEQFGELELDAAKRLKTDA
jgi:hypothetical protein